MAETVEGAGSPEAELIPMDEVRSILRMGLSKLYDEINAGHLKTVKVGRRRYTTRRFIALYVADLEAQALRADAA